MKNKSVLICIIVFLLIVVSNNAYAAKKVNSHSFIRGTKVLTLSSSSEGFIPSFGFYVADNLSLTASYSDSNLDADIKFSGVPSSRSTDNTTYGLKLTYDMVGVPIFVPFIGISYNSIEEVDADRDPVLGDSKTTTDISGFGITFGVKYFLSKRSSINFGYKIVNAEGDLELDSGTVNLKTDVSEIFLGYSYYFDITGARK